MNFKFLPNEDELLDIAFRRARERAAELKMQRGGKLKGIKSKEIGRVETAANYLQRQLRSAVDAVPELDELHPFYRELAGTIIDVVKLKKALAQMGDVAKIVGKLKKQTIAKIKAVTASVDVKGIPAMRENFYGRAASLVKDLKESIAYYNECGRKLRELPSIDFSLPTVIIAGYPNTGKTTLLSRLTGSRPEIAPYPFTTKGIMIGYMMHGYAKIQVVDTPGLLDKEMEKRNAVEMKAVAALRHLANAIVFVVDPTLRAGFPLEKQVALLGEVKEKFPLPIVVVLNKADVASKGEIEAAKSKISGRFVLEGEGIKSRLHEEIVEALKGKKGGEIG